MMFKRKPRTAWDDQRGRWRMSERYIIPILHEIEKTHDVARNAKCEDAAIAMAEAMHLEKMEDNDVTS